jgi:hypothetical protein
MDGIVGVLKRMADKYVARGSEIPSVSEFGNQLVIACPGVALAEVWPTSIDPMKTRLPKKIAAVPGVIEVHQVPWGKADN